MAVRNVQVFGLAVESQFRGLTAMEKRYAHHMARYAGLSPRRQVVHVREGKLTMLKRHLVWDEDCPGTSLSGVPSHI